MWQYFFNSKKIASKQTTFIKYTTRKDMSAELALPGTVNLDAPRWDQSTFWGRFRHFLAITDWRKALYTNSQLDEAKGIVEAYK